MSNEIKGPTYNAYVVTKREGKDDWWSECGAAFAHADGKGFNLLLHSLPIDGKIVLRPPKADTNERSDQRQDQREEPRNTRSQSNNRGRR
jgi:hypothetical protein